jgi:hypothetical protein
LPERIGPSRELDGADVGEGLSRPAGRVLVAALLAVSLIQRGPLSDLGEAVRDMTREHHPKARAARELRSALLAERRALAGFLLTGEPAEAARLQQGRRDFQRWRAELADAGLSEEEQALYAAKEGGRDRVVAGPAVESGTSTPEGQHASR